MDDSTPSFFEKLAENLREIESLIQPSEYHGMVCGRLAANALTLDPAWSGADIDFLGLDEATVSSALGSVLELPQVAAEALNDPDCSFQLLLPGEDWSFESRVAALGDWCEGFLLGLALGGLDQGRWDGLSPEVAEGMNDLAAIAQIEEQGEGDESDFMQLYEYVRMVVLSVCAELVSSGRDELPEEVPQPTHSASHLFGKSDKLH